MRVAIVGAGLGGLCLAQGLRRHGIEATVYEHDDALDSRGQGYRLHLDAGEALHSCLPPDLYELCVATSGRPSTRLTVIRGDSMRIVHQHGGSAPADGYDPLDPRTLSTSVNRQTFREVLAARLDDALVFGRTCTGFEQDGSGVRVHFANDAPDATADLLVAADGVHSVIRRQYLPHARIETTPALCVFGRTPLTDDSRPLIPAYTWEGFTGVAGPRVGLAAGVLDFREAPPAAAARIAPDVELTAVQPYLMWAVTGSRRRLRGRLDPADPATLNAAAAAAIRSWHPDLRRLVELAAAEETMLTPIRTSVPIEPWPTTRVTLLGDAIHAMSPARGSGANTALRDAALLAAELGAAQRGEKPVLQAVHDYEQRMIEDGFAAVEASRRANRSWLANRLSAALGRR